MLSQVLQYTVQENGGHFRFETFIPFVCWGQTKLCCFLSNYKCNTELVDMQLFHKYIVYKMQLPPSHAIQIIIVNNSEYMHSTLSIHMLKQFIFNSFFRKQNLCSYQTYQSPQFISFSNISWKYYMLDVSTLV